MKYLSLKKETSGPGTVFVVTMTNGAKANTFTDEVIAEHEAVCKELNEYGDNAAVILTSDDPKFWSNGINLEWLLTQGGDYFPKFKEIIDHMLITWATLRMPTIAALNGHAFGGGAILSCCFDYRLMRSDKGFFCFPEVDVDIPFTDAMHLIIDSIADKRGLWDLAFTGRRVGGDEAKALSVVHGSYPNEELMPKAMELAQVLSQKNRATYTAIKRGLKRNLASYWPPE